MTPDALAFHCDIARFENHSVVGIHGVLDHNSAPHLERDVLATLIPPMHGIVLDFAYCTAIEEAGVSALLTIYERAQWFAIDLRLTSVPRPIRPVLVASGLADACDH